MPSFLSRLLFLTAAILLSLLALAVITINLFRWQSGAFALIALGLAVWDAPWPHR